MQSAWSGMINGKGQSQSRIHGPQLRPRQVVFEPPILGLSLAFSIVKLSN